MYQKYFYKGQSLVDYCKENGINYSVIIKSINKIKRNKPNLDIDTLVNTAIAKHESSNLKYTYKGTTLYSYCKSNGLPYGLISNKFIRARNNADNKLSDEELIDIAIDTHKKGSKDLKYFYKGMTLLEYCKQNNLKYITLIKRIKSLTKTNPSLSDEQLIEMAINYNKNDYTYNYKGISLYSYCKKNNIKYMPIIYRIRIMKSKEEYKDYDDQKIIEEALASQIGVVKYQYKGINLSDYCKKMDIKYSKILKRIQTLKSDKEYANYDLEKIIELALIDGDKDLNKKYFYKGVDLVSYCKEHNLDSQSIRARMIKLKGEEKYKDYTDNELIVIAIETDEKRRTSYTYKGVDLRMYCKENKLNYDRIVHNIREFIKNKNLSKEDAVELVMNEHRYGNSKYTYKGISLREYCKINNIEYSTIMIRIRALKKKEENNDLSDEQIIELSLKKKIKKSGYIYKGMDLKDYCAINGIDYNAFKSKVSMAKKLEGNALLTNQELIEKLMVEQDNNSNKYTYQGKSLKQYCSENGLGYSKIVRKIEFLKKKESYKQYSEEQLAHFVVNDYRICVYHYKGLPLNIYCKENNLDYQTIFQRIHFIKRSGKYNDKSDSEIIDIVLSEKYGNKKTKYYYDGVSLESYCKNNGLNMSTIRSRIKALKRNIQFKDCSLDILIDMAIHNKNKKR